MNTLEFLCVVKYTGVNTYLNGVTVPNVSIILNRYKFSDDATVTDKKDTSFMIEILVTGYCLAC